MEMGVYEYRNGFIKLYAMPAYGSLVWLEGWQKTGQAQAVYAATPRNIDIVHVGAFLGIPKSKTLMYIHSVKIDGEKLWAYAVELKGLLDKQAYRASMTDGVYANEPTPLTSAQILSAVNSCCQLAFYDSSQNSMSSASASRRSIDEADTLSDCMAQYMGIEHCGYAMELKPNGKAALTQYNGVDHSADVRLATALGNVGSITISESDQRYCNRVVVIGRDNTDSGVAYSKTVDRSGIAQDRLIFSHKLDIGSDYPRPDDVSQADYLAAMESRGQSALNGGLKRSLEIKVDTIDGSLWGNPLGLGDIVTVYVPELELTAQKRVTAVQFTAENNAVLTKMQLG